MMITKLVCRCDPSSLADISQADFAEAFENEVRVDPLFREASIEVEFAPALSNEIVSIAGEDLPDDIYERFAEFVRYCGQRAFDHCCSANAGEKTAWQYAVRSQGYTGTFAAWMAMGADERSEYEAGAAGIPTT